jgi:dolichol-phosphate mannosyltransferase
MQRDSIAPSDLDRVESTRSQSRDLVSVVVPTFREALNLPHLIPAISSAMRKAAIDFEIIVVDDDSQDGTAECVSELQQRHPLRLVLR